MKRVALFTANLLLVSALAFSQPCINPAQIDPTVLCSFIYDPVCGCNGVTYNNQCEALYYGGVTRWTPGPCQGPPPCEAAFIHKLDSIGYGVQFVNTSRGSNLAYQWDFGDNTTSALQDPHHEYNPAGGKIYLACLTVSDTINGCFGTYCDYIFLTRTCKDNTLIDLNRACPLVYMPVCGCDSITYSNPCEAIYYGGVTSWTQGECYSQPPGCYAYFWTTPDPADPLTVYFYGSSFGLTLSHSWDFGDGSVSSDEAPVYTYATPGIYQVCYTVYDASIGCNQSYCQYIYAGSSVCIDSSIIDNAAGCPDIYDPVCGCNGVTYSSACDAMYGAGVTSFYPGECWTEKCEAWFWYSQDAALTHVQFYDYSWGTTPNTSWLWDFGDGSVSTDKNPFHIFTDTTQDWFYVCLTVYDSLEECYASYCEYVYTDSSYIIVPEKCYAYFTYTQDSTLRNVQFTDYSWGTPTSWSWDFGDGTSSSQQHPYHQFTDTTQSVFLVCLSIYNSAEDCYNTYCEYVYTDSAYLNPCRTSFGWAVDTASGMVVFTDSGFVNPGSYNYEWNFGDGTTSTDPNPQHSYPQEGYYWTCLTVYYPDSCIDIFCDSVYALAAEVSSVNEKTPASLSLEVFPNPFSTQSVIRYYLPSAAAVSINVADILGRKTELLRNNFQQTGLHDFIWTADLPEGIYLIELVAGNIREVLRVSVMK